MLIVSLGEKQRQEDQKLTAVLSYKVSGQSGQRDTIHLIDRSHHVGSPGFNSQHCRNWRGGAHLQS